MNYNLKKEKIVVAAGGTLGHLNPAISLADELLKRGYKIYFITLDKNRSAFLNKYSDVKYFNTSSFNRKKLFINIKNFMNNLKQKKQLYNYLKDIKADLIISFGASIGSIACQAAIKNNIKIIIHEQNSVLGLGNKLVYKKVNKVFLTMPCDIDGDIIGNPQITKFYENYKPGNEERILIVCGTNGAKEINNFFINNYKKFNDYKITIVVGNKYYNENFELINSINNEKFKIISFQTNMMQLYEDAKVVICRSGSTTLSEVMGMRKLVLTIPSPNVVDNHQYKNAIYYKKLNCLEMIEEKDLSFENIMMLIGKLIKEEDRFKENIQKSINVYSLYVFVDEVEKILNG